LVLGNKFEFASSFIISRTTSLSVLILIVSGFVVIANLQTANGDYVFDRKWGSFGVNDGTQFKQPSDVTKDSSNHVFVADSRNRRIQEFQLASHCPTGTTQVVAGVCFVTKWGQHGSANGQFYNPFDLATDSSNNVFVVDSWNNRIQKFTNSGNFITAWGRAGSGLGEFNLPQSIAVDSSGYVYVVDKDNSRIQKFSNDGAFIGTWGGAGSGPGEFMFPNRIAVDSSLNVFVSDPGNQRIQEFTNNGAFIRSFGAFGDGFDRVTTGTVLSKNYLFQAGDGFHQITIFFDNPEVHTSTMALENSTSPANNTSNVTK
jgi:6-bladed beta-propeller protein/NHL repeat-containing protein